MIRKNPIAYHGSRRMFSMAEARPSEGFYGPGMYFTSDPQEALHYADRPGVKGSGDSIVIYECDVQLKRPLFFHEFFRPDDISLREWFATETPERKAVTDILERSIERKVGPLETIRKLKAFGYDGIVVDYKRVVGPWDTRVWYVLWDTASLVCKTAASLQSNPIPANVVNKKLYARVKAEVKRKFKVYPSAYANARLVREYKKRGGRYSGPRRGNPVAKPFSWEPRDDREAQRIEYAEHERVVPTSISDSAGSTYALRVFVDYDGAEWVLRASSGEIVGYGTLEEQGDVHAVNYARIKDAYQRRGLYPEVIRVLRGVLGPIQSDWSLTAGAEQAWKKLGAEYVPATIEKRAHYRFNPSEPATVEQIATAPVGAILQTADGLVLYRKYGPKKTDWEQGQFVAESWRAFGHQKYGETFLQIIRKREPLFWSKA